MQIGDVKINELEQLHTDIAQFTASFQVPLASHPTARPIQGLLRASLAWTLDAIDAMKTRYTFFVSPHHECEFWGGRGVVISGNGE